MTIPPNDPPGQAAVPKRAIVSVPLSPLEKRMLEDLRWAARSPEMQQHSGKLAVIRNKRLLAVGFDQSSLLAQASAQEQCPEWELVVYLVPPMEEFCREEFWETPK